MSAGGAAPHEHRAAAADLREHGSACKDINVPHQLIEHGNVRRVNDLADRQWHVFCHRVRWGFSSGSCGRRTVRAALKASAYRMCAVVECTARNAGTALAHRKVNVRMTNGNITMQILADIGGFMVLRPEYKSIFH
ncbi:hypothetical protein GGX14DRAFT_574061 [Mycena pura]|uniref:Uncharacterized protein n=1 Tax=Mycena pura TaxID=153505 RepID=A0AAD6Y3M9_9AGAR|nr:hypothetical protein GGX14DRAFT_574061 [Mycena pura]